MGTLINSTGTSLIYTAPDTVTINEPGTYFILYHTLVANTATAAGDVGASLVINGDIISNAAEYVPATTTQTQIALQHNITVNEGFPIPIEILNDSSVANIYHDSSLSIIKLG